MPTHSFSCQSFVLQAFMVIKRRWEQENIRLRRSCTVLCLTIARYKMVVTVFNSKLAELQYFIQQQVQVAVLCECWGRTKAPVRVNRSLLPGCLAECLCLQIAFFLGVCLFRALCQTLFSHLGNHCRPHWHLNFYLSQALSLKGRKVRADGMHSCRRTANIRDGIVFLSLCDRCLSTTNLSTTY